MKQVVTIITGILIITSIYNLWVWLILFLIGAGVWGYYLPDDEIVAEPKKPNKPKTKRKPKK